MFDHFGLKSTGFTQVVLVQGLDETDYLKSLLATRTHPASIRGSIPFSRPVAALALTLRISFARHFVFDLPIHTTRFGCVSSL